MAFARRLFLHSEELADCYDLESEREYNYRSSIIGPKPIKSVYNSVALAMEWWRHCWNSSLYDEHGCGHNDVCCCACALCVNI